jgi:hypothetical protein
LVQNEPETEPKQSKKRNCQTKQTGNAKAIESERERKKDSKEAKNWRESDRNVTEAKRRKMMQKWGNKRSYFG